MMNDGQYIREFIVVLVKDSGDGEDLIRILVKHRATGYTVQLKTLDAIQEFFREAFNELCPDKEQR